MFLNLINKTVRILFILGILFFSSSFILAEEKINDFNVNIKINPDSSIVVTENIKYDFGEEERHGIIRDIPIKYGASISDKSIKLEIQKVERDGINENYHTSIDGLNKSIKIGNANFTIKGENSYVIAYKVSGAISYFDNYDELYWNITGNDWIVPIDRVSASIELPLGASVTQSSCYLGVLKSKEKCNLDIINNVTSLISSRSLNSGEGITIAVGFPKGIVSEDLALYSEDNLDNTSFLGKSLFFLFLLTFILPGIITFLIMFFIWKKKGKDLKYSSTIIAQYEPPENMKPTLVGSLIDGRVDFTDITAGLIYLAEQGFIKINKIEKQSFLGTDEHELELLKNDASSLEITEKNILNLFFDSSLIVGTKKKLSEFRKDISFPVRNKKVVNEIYQEMTDRGFYEKNPMKAKTPYIITGIVFFFLGIFGFSFLLLPSIIIFIFGFMMVKKTKLGIETRNYILGFKIFLSVTEKDRIDFHNAPERNPEQFMEFLPYAIALGVENKWAKQFEGIYMEQPHWYHSNTVSSFLAADFVSSISSLSNTMNSFSGGGSGSGGRGFSGGGAGGGGGRSW